MCNKKISSNIFRGGFACFQFQIPHGVCRTFSNIKIKMALVFIPLTITDKQIKYYFLRKVHIFVVYTRISRHVIGVHDGDCDKKKNLKKKGIIAPSPKPKHP